MLNLETIIKKFAWMQIILFILFAALGIYLHSINNITLIIVIPCYLIAIGLSTVVLLSKIEKNISIKKDTQSTSPKEFILSIDDGYIAGDYTPNEVYSYMHDYALLKQIEENKSLLEMAKLHMDTRAVLVIEERIKALQLQSK